MNPSPQTKDSTNLITIIAAIILIIFAIFLIPNKKALNCKNNEILYNNVCYNDKISCLIENGNGMRIWEGDRYSECIVQSCNTGFEILNNKCTSIVRNRVTLFTGDFIADKYEIGEYPKIKINSKILGGTIKFTVDFTKEYVEGIGTNYVYGKTSDGKPARSVFSLNFFLGDNSLKNKSPYTFGYGGFYDVYSKYNGGDLRNDNSRGLYGLVEGIDILGGYTWEIPVSNEVFFATSTKERQEGYQYKPLRLLDYINKFNGKELYIGGILSNAGIEGRKFTNIKNIEINYIGEPNAIEFTI